MNKIFLFLLLFSLNFATAQCVEFRGVEYTIVRADPRKESIRLYWKDEMGSRFGSFGKLKAYLDVHKTSLLFAMNAGIFSPEYVPLGLHIAEGKELVPLNQEDGQGNFFLKPNGVFSIEKKTPTVVETSMYAARKHHPELAVQSGPLLVCNGQIHPAFRSESTNRYVRNGVGVNAKGEVCFAISKVPVTFHEFATFFKVSLQCQNALYLDGAISRIYCPELLLTVTEGDYAGILAITRP